MSRDLAADPAVSALQEALSTAFRGSGAARRFVTAVLDRRDREGRFPERLTLDPAPGDAGELRALLPPAALREAGGRLRVNLSRWREILARSATDRGEAPPDLERLLDATAGRNPRSRREEEARFASAVVDAIERGFGEGRSRAVAAGAAPGDLADRLEELHLGEARRGVGELFGLARGSGNDEAAEVAARLLAGVVLATSGTPMRLDDLSRRVAGHTKALRPDAPDHGRLADTLFALDPGLRERVESLAPGSQALRRRLTFEACGITGNDATIDVLVQGEVVLEIEDERLEDAGRLARCGLPARISLAALRAARRIASPAAVVLCLENETAFHHAARRGLADLVVLTEGQASWAVVALLRGLVASGTSHFAHTGDLDRSGLLILRSLRRRTGIAIASRWMDAPTYDACRSASLPMSGDEIRETERLQASWDQPDGDDLLARLVAERRWIEQEAVLEILG